MLMFQTNNTVTKLICCYEQKEELINIGTLNEISLEYVHVVLSTVI